MSASLVGSEMCIRDSVRTLQRPSESCPPHVQLAMGSKLGRLNSAERGGAVSYTHLTLPTICSV
eukprot:9326301-Alexandrium_andersonii.AAC.1